MTEIRVKLKWVEKWLDSRVDKLQIVLSYSPLSIKSMYKQLYTQHSDILFEVNIINDCKTICA